MTTASQTMVGRIIATNRDRIGVILMVLGAAVLVASIAGKALMPPRALQDNAASGITPQ